MPNYDVIRVFDTPTNLAANLKDGMFGFDSTNNRFASKRLSDSVMKYVSDDSQQLLLATAQNVTGIKTFTVDLNMGAGADINLSTTSAINASSGAGWVGVLAVNSGTTDQVATFTSSDDTAIIKVSDNDTDVYVVAKDSTMSLGLNAGLSENNLNIDATGYVGIGITNPTEILYIYESADATVRQTIQNPNDGSSARAGLNISQGTAAPNSLVLYTADPSYATAYLANRGAIITSTSSDGISLAARNTTGDIRLHTGASTPTSTQMIITDGGDVGINDDTPSYKLDVNSGTTDIAARFVSSDDLASIIVSDDDTTVYVTAKDSKMSLGLNAGLSANNLNIDGSGNVALGATSASYKLDVTGTFRATGAAIFGTSVNLTDDIPINLGALGDAVVRYASATTSLDLLAAGVNDVNIEALGGDCYIQKTVGGDVLVFSGAVEGETPVVDVYGYRTGDALRTLSIGISSAYDDTASFSGLSSYYFDDKIIIKDATFDYTGSTVYVINPSGPTIVQEGLVGSRVDLLTIGDISTNFGSKGLKIGGGQPGADQTILFNGETSDYTIAAMEDEQELRVSGNDATNYLAIEADGTVELNGTATAFEDVNIDLSPLQTGGTAPGFDTIGTTGIRLRSFSVAEDVDGAFEIPHDYKLGSDITPHIHFAALSAPSGTDQVRWQLDYFIVDNGGVVTTATTINTGDVAVDTLDERVDANFPTFSHATLGGQVGFKLSRISQAGDTFTGEAGVFTFGFHYERDGFGSRQITTK